MTVSTVARRPPPRHPLPDDAYRRMSWVLRGGLLASVALLLTALAAYLVEHPSASSADAISSNPIAPYLTLGGLAHGLGAGAPEAYLALGVFVLIATPIVRVAAGAYYFHRARERTIGWVTITVLVLLVFGVLVLGPWIR